jgi:uncharacterized protein YceK
VIMVMVMMMVMLMMMMMLMSTCAPVQDRRIRGQEQGVQRPAILCGCPLLHLSDGHGVSEQRL